MTKKGIARSRSGGWVGAAAAVLAAGTFAAGSANAALIPVTFDFGVLGPVGHANPVAGGLTLYPNNTDLTYTTSSGGSVAASIVASAVNTPSRNWQLTQRGTSSEGGDEKGLGVQSQPDITPTPREIAKDEFVILDFTHVLAAGGKILSISIGSIQADGPPTTCEGFEVFESGTAPASFAAAKGGNFIAQSGHAGPPVSCGSVTQTVTLTGAQQTDPYYSVTALQADNPLGIPVHSPDNDIVIETVVVELPAQLVPEPASIAIMGGSLAALGLIRRRRG